MMYSQPMKEEAWISILDFENRGRGRNLWFRPGEEEPKIKELDTYTSGIFRQFNRLGFYTNGSCHGYGRHAAYISVVKKENNIYLLNQLLLALGVKVIRGRDNGRSYVLYFPLARKELLVIAEKMSVMKVEWLERRMDYVEGQLFYTELEEMLSIPGLSGKEWKIREKVKEKLTPYVDFIMVDWCGNLLAEKTYRTGRGPTIVLNAHLDTVKEIVKGRRIRKENGIW
ncbi:hypothetical protein [Massilibacterium senegalense]|uniref:hypothetical protein n=1 Tax=Massilibacterium senegalense TaxID=1632858 RepID=UPI001E638CA0|nr:hypothetical protein [Massilibacterium senegalense]